MKRYFVGLLIIFFALTGQTCSLLGSTASGVYRSIDNGKTWQSIDELKIKGERTDNPSFKVFSLVVDPKNPDIIYAGTLTRGIYKTENGGRTWGRINKGITLSGRQPIFYDIVVDPKDDNNVYCGGKTMDYGKIYKSTNGGGEWREVFSESQKDLVVTSLAISFSNPKIIIAGSQAGSVYATTDGGETWQHAGWLGDQVVSVGVSNDDSDVIYAATKSKGAFRTDNFGKNWVGITKKIGPDKETDSNNNGLAIGRLAVAPSNGNVLYLGTRAGIYRSSNRGRSWILLPTLLPPDFAPLTSDIKVTFKNPNIIYFSVPNIVYKAENSGNKWISFQLSINAQVNKLAIDPENPNVIYAGVGK